MNVVIQKGSKVAELEQDVDVFLTKIGVETQNPLDLSEDENESDL